MSAPPSLFLHLSLSLRHSSFSLSLCPFSLVSCLSTPFSLSLSCSHRQQWQWFGAVNRAAPARGAGPAPGSDQVHQERASVSLQRFQERMSDIDSCRNILYCSTPFPCFIDLTYSNIYLFLSSCLEQECPSGMVDEETFKTIYSQFFPQGG